MPLFVAIRQLHYHNQSKILMPIVLMLFFGISVHARDVTFSSNEQNQRPVIQSVLQRDESRWRDAYKHEIAKPTLVAITESTNYLATALQNVMVGMSENDLRECRKAITEGAFAAPIIRETFEYIPAILSEHFENGSWESASYRIHRRRLAAVILTSCPVKLLVDSDALIKPIYSKCVALAGKPAKKGVTLDGQGQPNRGAVVWWKGAMFVVVSKTVRNDDCYVVTLIVGARQYYDDIMKHYLFSDIPDAEVETIMRKSFSFLPEASDLNDKNK